MLQKRNFLLLILLGLTWAGSVQLKAGQDQIYLTKNKTIRFLNTEKSVVAVREIDGHSYRLTGLQRGTAYVYFWDENKNQEVVKVQVLYNKEQVQAKNKKASGRFEVYFKFDPVNDTPVNKRMVNEKFYYETMLGPYALTLFAENKNIGKTKKANIEQLAQYRLALSRGAELLVIGDENIRYTPLTVPYLSIQGGHGRTNLWGFNIDLFGGKKAGEYYGNQVLDHATRDKSINNIQGGRITKKLFNDLEIGITAVNHEGRDSLGKRIINNSIKSLDTTYKFNDYAFRLETAEESISKNKCLAQEYQADYSTTEGGWTLTYRNIDPRYTGVADYFNYQGARGYFLHGRYSALKNLGISGLYENYHKSFDDKTLLVNNFDYTTQRSRLNLNFMLNFLRPSLAFFNTIRLNPRYSIYSEYRGYSIFLDQFSFGPISTYYEFSPVMFKDIQYPTLEYTGSLTKSGIRTKFGVMSIRLEHQSEVYYYSEAVNSNPHGYNFILYFGKFILPETTINADFSYWFQNRKNSQETLDKNTNSVKLGLSQNLTDSFYWYLNGIATQENSLKYEFEKRVGYFMTEDLTRSEISGGCVYNF